MKKMIVPLAAMLMLAGCDEEKCARIEAFDAVAWAKSEWISVKDAPVAGEAEKKVQRAADGTSCFWRQVVNRKTVTSAKWMTAGLGVYELYLNGKSVGQQDALKPGFTHARKTKVAFTYDVTPLLNCGAGEANDFGAEVSAGWWRDKIVGYAGTNSAFRGVIELAYADGTKELVGTKASEWFGTVGGPVKHAGIFDGEEYDARETDVARSPSGAFKAGGCVRNDEFKGEVVPTVGAEVCRRFDLAMKKGPCSLKPGETIVIDFGQNCAGVPFFRFKAARGTVLTALFGEMVNDADKDVRGCDGPKGSLYRANLRIPDDGMRVVYTFSGDGEETYLPRFTFFGYRYASLTATAPVEVAEFASVPVTSVTKEMELGSLETGDKDVNRLIANVYWGQLSNYLSVPTDCPQRNERLGWTADTQVFTDAGAFNADTTRFFHKWMRDMRDTRNEYGTFPGVAPYAQYGAAGFMRTGWADAGIIVPWKIWRQFGDREIVDANWEAMEKFALRTHATKREHEAVKAECGDYQWNDWLSLDRFESASSGLNPEFDAFTYEVTPEGEKSIRRPGVSDYWSFLGGCYWAIDMEMMKEMAAATGRDAAKWAAREKEAKAYLKATYFKTADGTVRAPFADMQTPAVMALKLGLVEGAAKAKTIRFLKDDLAKRGNVTGFLGCSWLMDVLAANGMERQSVDLLLNHRFPSWLYSVDQGATTIWERWNGWTKEKGFGPVWMNSYNHYAYGQVLGWMYRRLAGIEPVSSAPGFKRIVMKPIFDKRLGYVKASYRSAAGLITSEWKYEDDKVVWNFTVPEGAVAEVTLPGESAAKEYPAGSYRLECCVPVFVADAPSVKVERVFREARVMRGNTNLAPLQPIDSASWIWSEKDEVPESRVFRCAFEVKEGEGPVMIDVSADERFYLTVDGQFVGRGPHRGTVENWMYETYRLTLAPGRHELRAVVTRLGGLSPLAQISHAGGFILKAEEPFDKRLTTGVAKWQVAADTSLAEEKFVWAVGARFRVTGSGPYAVEPSDWTDAKVVRGPVKENRYGVRTLGWMLFPSQLKDQTEDLVAPGAFRAATHAAKWCEEYVYSEPETKAPEIAAFDALLRGKAVTVPAKTKLQLAWHLGRYICAYPLLSVSGGKGAKVGWMWMESSWTAKTDLKRQRDEIVGKYLGGNQGDVFVSDGRAAAEFSAPWFRCGLWCRLDIETQDEPLTLTGLKMIESRYPVELESAFASPQDATLPGVRTICARAMQMCAHEMLFDCPYYEQQMYPGDTRVQLLTLTAMSPDDRLIKRAIEIYDLATRDDGQCPFNFPTRGTQEGFSYTLPYICMYGDYVMNHADRAWLRARLPGLRKAMSGCELYENADGLVEHTPGWNFMDWSEGWEWCGMPLGCNYGYELNAFNNLFWLNCLQAAAKVERAFGNGHLAAHWEAKAERLKGKVIERFWNDERGLFADIPGGQQFSEHCQALALLADVLPEKDRVRCFEHLIADKDLVRTTVYFSYYLFETYFKFGRGDLFQKRLDLWRDYVKKGLTTTQEAPDKGKNGQQESRSDCHAWGTHPIWFMQTGLAGIRSDAPFFEKVRVAPCPGTLREIHAKHPHPQGWIEADLVFADGKATGTVKTPVAGTFVYGDRTVELKAGMNAL